MEKCNDCMPHWSCDEDKKCEAKTQRLIDADALAKKWQDVLDEKAEEKGTVAYLTFELFIDRLKLEPTIEAEPVKHGRWNEGEKNRFWGTRGNYICSNCQSSTGYVKFNYCPNCGAKMDLEGE